MGYIQSREHFSNYIQKAARQSSESIELLPEAFYFKHVYDTGHADEFAWDVKHAGAHLLMEPHIWEWIRRTTAYRRRPDYTLEITKVFSDLLEDLETVHGVYSFWSTESVPLYIGHSISLGKRMRSSYNRFITYDRPVFVRYIATATVSDAIVLEAYFITTLNPSLNVTGNYGDGLTINVSPIPKWSLPIQCNLVTRE